MYKGYKVKRTKLMGLHLTNPFYGHIWLIKPVSNK